MRSTESKRGTLAKNSRPRRTVESRFLGFRALEGQMGRKGDKEIQSEAGKFGSAV